MDSQGKEDHLSLFRRTRRQLPIRKESFVQLGKGRLDAIAMVVQTVESTLYLARVATHSSTLAELDSDHTGIVLPLAWNKDFSINGVQVDKASIYTPVDNDLFLAHGWERQTVAAAFSRNEMTHTMAVLHGVGTEDILLPSGSITLAPAAVSLARNAISALLHSHQQKKSEGNPGTLPNTDIAAHILSTLCDLYMQAIPATPRKIRQGNKLGKIIRAAEEFFESRQSGPLSLADICTAANVSQGTLYHAFGVMCGTTPLNHFKNRRLTDARADLLKTRPSRGAIKKTALNHGLSHLSRFSVEYHQLFGEYPTVTLSRNR